MFLHASYFSDGFLFWKFIETDQPKLLEYATLAFKKVLTSEDGNEKEGLYINSLLCSKAFNNVDLKFNLVHAILYSIGMWCNEKLLDYHLHFSQVQVASNIVHKIELSINLFFISRLSYCFL